MLTLINTMKSFLYENINMGIIESIPDVKNRILAPGVKTKYLRFPRPEYNNVQLVNTHYSTCLWANLLLWFSCWETQMLRRDKIIPHITPHIPGGGFVGHLLTIIRNYTHPNLGLQWQNWRLPCPQVIYNENNIRVELNSHAT